MKATTSDELAANLYRLTDALSRRSGTSALVVMEESGATPGQIKALRVLSRHDGPMSIGALAASLVLSMPTASRTVDALSQRGFVERRVCREDRRSRDLELTPGGRDLVERVAAARIDDLRVVVDGLSASQRARLGAALAALRLDAPVPA